jgi:hypothetical protein
MNPISVLLVDDNPTFWRIATRFLQEHDDVVVGRIFRHPLRIVYHMTYTTGRLFNTNGS